MLTSSFESGRTTAFNAKALRVKQAEELRRKRDECSRLTARLFIVSSTDGRPQQQVLEAPLLQELELLAARVGVGALRAPVPVRVEGKIGMAKKMHLVLSAASLEIRDASSCSHKNPERHSLLRCMPFERSGKPIEGPKMELLTPAGVVSLVFDSIEERDACLADIVDARLALLSLLIDWSPTYRRTFIDPTLMRKGTRTATTSGTGPSEDKKSLPQKLALLEYQRIVLVHSLAATRHEKFSQTVEETLAKLEAQRLEKERLRSEIGRLESSVSKSKWDVTRQLNTLFDKVLKSASEVQEALGPHMQALKAPETVRKAIALVNEALVIDAPLKEQLEELAKR